MTGTLAALVVGTSWRDDSVAGDNDGYVKKTGPAAGYWGGDFGHAGGKWSAVTDAR